MLKFLDKIFGKKTENNKAVNSPIQSTRRKGLDDLFLKHFNESPYFKKDSFDIVIKHLKHEVDINKSGEELTVTEKKELGLNTRLSITSDLIAVLSPKGLQLSNPKEALIQVYYRATFEERRIELFQKALSVGVSDATYRACKDERDCVWCKANDGVKFTISEDLNDEVNQNCICKWNRGCFIPDVNFKSLSK